MPSSPSRIAVLGAYGLAGEAIVRLLIEKTAHEVLATGRDEARLEGLRQAVSDNRLTTRRVDVTGADALRAACAGCALTINASGPYARFGADVAQTVLGAGSHYIDFASEQSHYTALRGLDSTAREKGLLLCTAAGLAPGISGLIAWEGARRLGGADHIDICFAQYRNPTAEGGVGSLLTGVHEMSEMPHAVRNGERVPVRVGVERKAFDLPPPMGRKALHAGPNNETLLLAERLNAGNANAWYYFGELPAAAVAVVRWLRPERRSWLHGLARRAAESMNRAAFRKAIHEGYGPEALLVARIRHNGAAWEGGMLFADGGLGTAVLPVAIADSLLHGRLAVRGLATPLELQPDHLLEQAKAQANRTFLPEP